jgi:hypothetical protein
MAVFEAFRKRHPISQCCPVPEESIVKYTSRLPEPILQLWREEGWCAYSGGLIWFVNPDEFVQIPPLWLRNTKQQTPLVFARTAFGDMFLWNGQAIYNLRIHDRAYERALADVIVLLDGPMSHDSYLEDACYLRLFQQALPRYGELTTAECYSFITPLINEGGLGINNVSKAQYMPELLRLAALRRTGLSKS